MTLSTTTQPELDAGGLTLTADWFKSAVFYEVLVRSFRDSDGDGIGDNPTLSPPHLVTDTDRSTGPVGTGKSSLIALVCRELAGRLSLAVITNDIYTDEDARFLRAAGVLAPERIRAVEQGPDGAIWLLEDEGAGRLLRLTPA